MESKCWIEARTISSPIHVGLIGETRRISISLTFKMPAVYPTSVRSYLLEMVDMEEPNDGRPDEDMSPVTNLMSDFLAMSQMSHTCSIHEQCSVNCGSERDIIQPLLVGNRKLHLSNSLKGIEIRESDTDVGLVLQQPPLNTFKYMSLKAPSEWIRLLEIEPARVRTAPLVAAIRDYPLERAPEFAALSYFWGPPQFDAEIVVDDSTLAITSNLAGCLRRYRSQSDKRTGLLWVDAICINQRDTHEVNNQLLLMRKIYQQAHMVYIDLGDVDVTWYAGFDLLHRLCFVREWIQHSSQQEFPAISTKYGIPSLDHPAWRAYFWLFTMPWFTRTWIVQEAALARQSEVLFGLFTFRWDTLVDSWNFIVQFGLFQPLSGDMRVSKGLLGLRDILNVRSSCHEGAFSDMLQIMRLTREFQASDARDKCFAVLSLIQDGSIGNDFKPDYAMTVGQVYQHFAEYLVRLGQGVTMLSYAGLQRRGDVLKIASWVPDWQLQSASIAPRALWSIRNQPFRAADSLESSIYIANTPSDEEHHLMIAHGAIVDQIIMMSDACDWGDSSSSPSSSSSPQTTPLKVWYQTALATYNTALESNGIAHSNPADAFARTLLVDDTYSDENACSTTTPISNPAQALGQVIESDLKFESPQSQPVWASAHRDEIETFRMQMAAAGLGRRLIVTRKGRLGLVPWCAEVGDFVSVILGSGVLFVVRHKCQERMEGKVKREEEERGRYEKKREREEMINSESTEPVEKIEEKGVEKEKEKEKKEQEKEEKEEKKKKKKGKNEKEEKEKEEEKWILIGDAYIHELMNGEALVQEGVSVRELMLC